MECAQALLRHLTLLITIKSAPGATFLIELVRTLVLLRCLSDENCESPACIALVNTPKVDFSPFLR
jgi:hypothetical protein